MDAQKLRLIFDALNEASEQAGGFNADDHPLQVAALLELKRAIDGAPSPACEKLKQGVPVSIAEMPDLQKALAHALSTGAVTLSGALTCEGEPRVGDEALLLSLVAGQKDAAKAAYADYMNRANRDDPMRMEMSSSRYEQLALDHAIDEAIQCAKEQMRLLRERTRLASGGSQDDALFEAWWSRHGQFCRAGGGDYEKTFAFRAWQSAREQLLGV